MNIHFLNVDRLDGQSDALYAALLSAHEGLSDEASAALDARLILLLMNALGNPALALAAIDEAAKGIGA